MTVLAWLPAALLTWIAADVAPFLIGRLPAGVLIGVTLSGLVTGWAVRPWQPPALRRQVRACGVSFGLLCVHAALEGVPRSVTVHAAEWWTLCVLIALWLPRPPGHLRRRATGRRVHQGARRLNRAIPLNPTSLETSG